MCGKLSKNVEKQDIDIINNFIRKKSPIFAPEKSYKRRGFRPHKASQDQAKASKWHKASEHTALKSAPQGQFFLKIPIFHQKSPQGRINHTIKIIKNNAYILISSQKVTKNKLFKNFSAQKLIHPLAILSTAHQKGF